LYIHLLKYLRKIQDLIEFQVTHSRRIKKAGERNHPP